MEAVDARRAWLEACLGCENDRNCGNIEQRNERRLKGDTDWTGVIVERLFDQERHAELKAQGLTVYREDAHYLDCLKGKGVPS